jgi:hypothetical protein
MILFKSQQTTKINYPEAVKMYITKKMEQVILEGKKIVNEFGYWSQEVKKFNNNLLTKFTIEKYNYIQDVIR